MSTGIAPAPCAPSTSRGTPRPMSSFTGNTAPVIQETCESATRRVRGVIAGLDRGEDLRAWKIANFSNAKRGARGDEPAHEPRVLGIGRHDLVIRPDAEPAENDVAALGRRGGQRDLLGRRDQEARKRCAKLLPLGQHLLEVRAARAPVLELPPLDRLHRLDARARQGPERAGVQVGKALEHREALPDGYEVDATTASTGAWSESTTPSTIRRSTGQASGPRSSWALRTRIWSTPPIGSEKPETGWRSRLKSPQRTQRPASARRPAARSISLRTSSGPKISTRGGWRARQPRRRVRPRATGRRVAGRRARASPGARDPG